MKYKIGDKVKIIKNLAGYACTENRMVGKIGKITVIQSDNYDYPFIVETNDMVGSFCEKEIQLISRTLRDMEVGDIIVSKYGYEAKILMVSSLAFMKSCWNMLDSGANGLFTFEQAEALGFRLKSQEEEVETVEIAGKKYNKQEFEEATRDLKEIKS